MYFVFPVFMLSPTRFSDFSTRVSISWASLIPSLTNAISSAKSISVVVIGGTLLLFLFLSWKPSLSSLPSKAVLITYSITITKRYGANVSPCKTPARMLKVSVSPLGVMTLAVVSSYNANSRQQLLRYPISFQYRKNFPSVYS